MKDICDGTFYKNHPILSDPISLGIIAYYDDVEVANPLGPKAKTHKLGVFYWSMINTDTYHRSHLSSINMLAIAKTYPIRKCGLEKLLKIFLDDLKALETGCKMEINGNSIIIKAALLAFPSDTLASNYIGKFKESPSFAFSPCRFCCVKKSEMKVINHENEVQLRNNTQHFQQVSAVTDANLSPEARKYWSKMYGAVGRSVLMSVPYFDITKCLTIDIMHILFEGVLLHEIKLLLVHCISQKYFKLNTLNSRLKAAYIIGGADADKPSEIDINNLKDPYKKLKQNAWQLAIVLPFLIGEFVPYDDKQFIMYIDLLKIVNLCVSYELTKEDISLLRHLVTTHLVSFRRLYGEQTITPKLHFLIHLPRQIEMFGPPRYLWCLHFEGKHYRLKMSAHISRSYKNICLTVTKRFEAYSCLELNESSEFVHKKYIFF